MNSSEIDLREAQRYKFKADVAAQRNARFKDHRQRTIGIDVAALDQQVAEKRRQKEADRDNSLFERKRNEDIDQLLESINKEEKQMRQQFVANIKNDWASAIEARQKAKLDASRSPVTEAPMRFDGEDESRSERSRLQHEQIKRWATEEIEDKLHRRAAAQKEGRDLAEMNRAYDEARLQNELLEKEMRREMLKSVMIDNLQSAAETRDRKAQARQEAYAPMRALPITDEVIDLAMDEHGHIIKKDMFKGYTQKQKNKIRLENEQIMEHNRRMKEQENQNDADWHRENLIAQRVMIQAELEEKAMRSAMLKDQLDTLQAQVQDISERRRKEREDFHVGIKDEFFSKFGTSCR